MKGATVLSSKTKECDAHTNLAFACHVRGRIILFKGDWPILEVFLHLGMSKSQNIVIVRVCVDFSACFLTKIAAQPSPTQAFVCGSS